MLTGVYQKTEEHKRKLGKALRGITKEMNPNLVHSEEHNRKISESHKGERSHMYGIPKSEETKKKISKSVKKYLENHSNWRGGISFESYPLEYKRIRGSIRKRDNYICQLCGKKQERNNNERLSIHHIDYDKMKNNPKNLISLCRSCNTEVNNDREVWVRIFQKRIKNIYMGKIEESENDFLSSLLLRLLLLVCQQQETCSVLVLQ